MLTTSAFSQSTTRISYANKDIFLSGINVAWVSFAGDLGPNPVNLSQLRLIFQTVRDNGGNALRFWLFTNGSQTPAYNDTGAVVGPGSIAISNLKQILNLARQYDVGLILCLWSFDMLRKNELDSARLHANYMMLTDTAYTMAFVRNALIPMVDSVKGDSAIIAWEVCNEPNGMTTGMNYYSGDPTISPTDVKRFTNLVAGGIHRADPNALVTTGPGSFQTLTDVQTPLASIKSALKAISSLSQTDLEKLTEGFNTAHRLNLTPQQMFDYLMKVATIPNSNYYKDSSLIAAGGDSLGKLDFYTVHYYYYNSSSTPLSPLTHPFSYWELTKPTAVTEFYTQSTDGVNAQNLYQTLYNNGYAGALAWSWTDFPNTPNNPNAANDTWVSLQTIWNSYRQDVQIFPATWPRITIVSPANNSAYPDSTQLKITAAVMDSGASMAFVRFVTTDSVLGTVNAASDTVSDTLYYSLEWENIVPGTYVISAVAVNSLGQQDSSASVQVEVGKPPMTRLSVKQASWSGSGISLKSDPNASGGYYLDIATSSGSVTWQFVNHDTAGYYPISFGYNLHYDTPKDQYIYINGTSVDTLRFDGNTGIWMEKTIMAPLIQDTNTVQMQLYWGWMYLDYLAVPTSIVTSVTAPGRGPLTYSLSQNYPNPFNPSTTISYQLPTASHVVLKVYDVLGRLVETLIDSKQIQGIYSVKFDGSKFASGVYFYRINISGNDGRNFTSTKKMLLLK
jgi:hypothetical protein